MDESFVKSQKELLAICNDIENNSLVAIDTEFMRERTYYPILCLIQLNVNNKCFVIDVLSKDIDLNPLFLILENKKVRKIFHSSRQDIEVLMYLTKKIPNSIIDTQIMANFCGFKYNISYAGLVEDFFAKKLSKQCQRSDWSKRPLHDDQIKYALIDVAYLPNIYDKLEERLEKEGKIKWFHQEMEYITKHYDINNQDLFKKFSFINKSPIYKENIKSLALWRDNFARKRNVPRNFILNDKLLSRIAEYNPKTVKELEECCSTTNINLVKRRGKDIINLLQENKITDSKHKVNELNFRLDNKQAMLYEKAKILLKKKSIEYNLQPEFIINQSNLRLIVLGFKTVEEVLFGWRYEIFGKNLIEENLLPSS